MKTETEVLDTAGKKSGHAQHEEGTDDLSTAENNSGGAKYEKGTRFPWYNRK
jgi:hypothetical protein